MEASKVAINSCFLPPNVAVKYQDIAFISFPLLLFTKQWQTFILHFSSIVLSVHTLQGLYKQQLSPMTLWGKEVISNLLQMEKLRHGRIKWIPEWEHPGILALSIFSQKS